MRQFKYGKKGFLPPLSYISSILFGGFKSGIYIGATINILLRVNRRRNKNEPNGGRKQKYFEGNSDLSCGMCGDTL